MIGFSAVSLPTVKQLGTAGAEDPCEGSSEISGPAGVDDRIHGRIDPAEPGDDGEDALRIVDALKADTRQQIGDEEGQPTGDEDAHHDAQRLGSFALLSYFRQFA